MATSCGRRASCPLGDELEFFGTRVLIGQSNDELHLDVMLEGSAYVTRPPEMSGADAGPAEETIVATAFRRQASVAPVEARRPAFRWQTVVGGVIATLILDFLVFVYVKVDSVRRATCRRG